MPRSKWSAPAAPSLRQLRASLVVVHHRKLMRTACGYETPACLGGAACDLRVLGRGRRALRCRADCTAELVSATCAVVRLAHTNATAYRSRLRRVVIVCAARGKLAPAGAFGGVGTAWHSLEARLLVCACG